MTTGQMRFVLLIAALALFFYAVRIGSDVARYVAIGMLVVAVILRFVGRRTRS
jgi:predicted membrane metal-binding protein